MKIRAIIKGLGEHVEGDLIDENGEPKLFLLDKSGKRIVLGIYKESIEFLVKDKWRNIVEGIELINAVFGEASLPTGLLEYYKERVREGKT